MFEINRFLASRNKSEIIFPITLFLHTLKFVSVELFLNNMHKLCFEIKYFIIKRNEMTHEVNDASSNLSKYRNKFIPN